MRQLKISESITNRSNRSLNAYLSEIRNYELLTADEEAQLAAKISQGDEAALRRLTNANLRFVVSVAKQYQNQGLVLEDLINEGNLGLLKAAKRFDETKGFKFISYAVWWIRQSILAAISVQSRTVRLPGNQITDLIRLKRSTAKLEQQLEREPNIEELAAELDVSKEKIKRSLTNAQRQVSFDAPSYFTEDTTLLDTFADNGPATDELLMAGSLKIDIGQLLQKLPIRERQILTMYFGLQNTDPKRLEEISIYLGLTPERVRQLKIKALTQLRKILLEVSHTAYN